MTNAKIDRTGIHRLTALEVKNATGPGVLHDGGGLDLEMKKAGSKSWVLRYRFGGKQREMGLGRGRDLPLADARELAADARKLVLRGIDPIVERDKRLESSVETVSFKAAALDCLEDIKATWTPNSTEPFYWRSTFKRWVHPIIGDRPVGEIGKQDMIRVLRQKTHRKGSVSFWVDMEPTAARVRDRIAAVLNWAVQAGLRSDDLVNPAEEKRLNRLFPASAREVIHLASLPHERVGELVAKLRLRTDGRGSAGRALEFLILTGKRSTEVRGARWSEIDWDDKIWTIPAERMKGKKGKRKQHLEPLTDIEIGILKTQLAERPIAGDSYIFPGRCPTEMLSDNALTDILHRMAFTDPTSGDIVTAHGFRSTFRIWAAEGGVPREIAEKCLAHKFSDGETQQSVASASVQEAYQRSQLLELRRPIMDRWSAYCDQPRENVVAFRKTA